MFSCVQVSSSIILSLFYLPIQNLHSPDIVSKYVLVVIDIGRSIHSVEANVFLFLIVSNYVVSLQGPKSDVSHFFYVLPHRDRAWRP